MNNIGIYTKRINSENLNYEITGAIANCMVGTGIHRIFTAEHVFELLKRLPLVFHQFDLSMNYFNKDYLFSYIKENECIKITLQDIEDHIGLETSFEKSDMMPFSDWLKNIKKNWQGAAFFGLFTGIQITVLKTIDADKKSINNKHIETPNNQEIEHAEKLASFLTGLISKQKFADFYLTHKKYILELEKRRIAKPALKFDNKRFDPDKLNHIAKHILGKYYTEGDTWEKLVFEVEELDVYNATYLAWLWANGFVTVHERETDQGNFTEAIVDEAFDFDWSLYEIPGEEGNYNLIDFFEYYRLGEIMSMLKENDTK